MGPHRIGLQLLCVYDELIRDDARQRARRTVAHSSRRTATPACLDSLQRCAMCFLSPEGGGTDGIVADHRTLAKG